jgi:hypothetical protein
MATASRPVRLIQLDGRCGCEYERSESTDARCLTARTALQQNHSRRRLMEFRVWLGRPRCSSALLPAPVARKLYTLSRIIFV